MERIGEMVRAWTSEVDGKSRGNTECDVLHVFAGFARRVERKKARGYSVM